MDQKEVFGIGEGDRVLQFASLSFDASLWELCMAWTSGACLYLSNSETLLAGQELARVVREGRITIATLPPTALTGIEAKEMEGMSRMIVAGEAVPSAISQMWSTGRRFFNAYGPTEVTVCGTVWESTGAGGKPPIGKPINNTRAYVLDHAMEPVPVGVVGELYIGGAGLARGYAGKPELTAERFVPDRVSGQTGERLYRTGDQCRWNQEGELEFIGRKDQQVKIRGYRIEIGEIEAVLKEHEEICDAVVTVQEKNAGEKLLVAYLVIRGGKKIETYELREYLHSRIPNYMVPSAFMRLGAIPLTASGKLDRQALKKWVFTPASDQQDPRNDTEALLAEVWKQVLRLERVGIHDSFFELGGDSIISLQVVARAQQQGVRITPRQLFESPTIAALATVAGHIDGDRIQTARQVSGEAKAQLVYPL